MGQWETRATRVTRTAFAAAKSAARAGATAGGGAGRVARRLTGASGAGRTGLQNLIELTAAGSFGDAFVAVALAGTLFFSTSVDQARGRIALALLITMAPFAVLAPLIGPMLDRVQQGRRFILSGTLLTRGLLCWGMAGAVQHNDALTLLPAAFGVLVLQKAYGVTRGSVTPRLLPSEITLVTANARSALASLIASTLGAAAAAGVYLAAGSSSGGPAWALRAGTLVYLAATILGLRLPDGIDNLAHGGGTASGATLPPVTAASMASAAASARSRPSGSPPVTTQSNPHGITMSTFDAAAAAGGFSGRQRRGRGEPGGGRPGEPGGGRPGDRIRWRTLSRVGPIVGEAMRANAALRAFSGFMIFFLAFLLRTVHFSTVPDKLALGEMIAAAAIGGFAGTAIGSALRSRAPLLIIFGMMAIATVVTALSAVFFGLWAALVVALVAALGQALVKLALDSIVQREIGEEIRSSTFAASETLHQLSWVAGGLAGLLMSLTNSGVAGLGVASAGLALSLTFLLLRRRRVILAARRARPGDRRAQLQGSSTTRTHGQHSDDGTDLGGAARAPA